MSMHIPRYAFDTYETIATAIDSAIDNMTPVATESLLVLIITLAENRLSHLRENQEIAEELCYRGGDSVC